MVMITENNSENNELQLESYLGKKRFGRRFMMNMVVLVVVVVLILVFKMSVVDNRISPDEMKSQIQITEIASQWIVKEKIKTDDYKGILLTPQITFRLKNIGSEKLKQIFVMGVFKFVYSRKDIGDASKMTLRSPLLPGETSEPITLTSYNGYRASSPEAFELNKDKWEDSLVELYLRSPNSRLFFFKSYYISKKIDGMNIDIKIM
jgi:hypothetical protein